MDMGAPARRPMSAHTIARWQPLVDLRPNFLPNLPTF
jgi:hypothetical protein